MGPLTAQRCLIALLAVGLLGLAVQSARVGPSGLPQPAFTQAGPFIAAEQRCAECHSDIVDSFHLAPHGRTLHRTSDPGIASRFAGRTFRREETGVDYSYELKDGRLWVKTSGYPEAVPIDWVFGSGMHAQTPLLLTTDPAGRVHGTEHAVSWYPDGSLDVTLGQDTLKPREGLETLGRPWGPAETISCFGCHSTEVPLTSEGKLKVDDIHPNLDCARCHWNVATHVREMDAGSETSIERFSKMSPADAVSRCGECHRRAEELGGPIEASNSDLARFAPVGLVQSPCFLKQETVTLENGQPARLDCTTCHDPHAPAIRDPQITIRQCLNCHGSAHDQAPNCSKSPRDSNCLPCHMPRLPANDRLGFTDHWIRIRDDR